MKKVNSDVIMEKGKDMILCDFLSRLKHDASDPYEIIPISFNIQEVLHNGYYNIYETDEERYFVQTSSQT